MWSNACQRNGTHKSTANRGSQRSRVWLIHFGEISLKEPDESLIAQKGDALYLFAGSFQLRPEHCQRT